MDLNTIIEFALSEYAGATALTAFIMLKGVAAVAVNNLDTQKWGKVGKLVDWLASSNKKAKLTGSPELDQALVAKIAESKPKNIVAKVLNFLS
jgi:hypothetical protein